MSLREVKMEFWKKMHREAAEAQKRWEAIDEKAKALKESLNTEFSDRDKTIKDIGELLIMFVDHLRPLNNYKTDEMEKSLKEALDLLNKE